MCVGHVVCRQDKKVKQSLLQVKDRIHALEGTSTPYLSPIQTMRIISNTEPIKAHLLVWGCVCQAW
jgi:hypothetical protein